MIFQSTAISTVVSDFCSSYRIEWRFIPERSPHFGRLWEAAVKSTKTHLRRCETILWRTHYCISSSWSLPEQPPFSACKYSWWWRHWGPDAWIFLDRQTPFCALPDPSFSYHSISLLRRWHLCQNLVHHFWQRWSTEYLTLLNRYNKWHHPTRNLDVVILKEDGTIPTQWPLARVARVYPGKDKLVRDADVKTAEGTYLQKA